MKKTRWGDHGQSTVEFALILPLVVLVVLFIVQAGFVVLQGLVNVFISAHTHTPGPLRYLAPAQSNKRGNPKNSPLDIK